MYFKTAVVIHSGPLPPHTAVMLNMTGRYVPKNMYKMTKKTLHCMCVKL